MADIKHTSSMVYPLEEPNGWFLKEMKHEHQKTGDNHYIPVHDRSWHVEFRRTVNSNTSTNVAFGRGHSMEEAWASAKRVAESAGE